MPKAKAPAVPEDVDKYAWSSFTIIKPAPKLTPKPDEPPTADPDATALSYRAKVRHWYARAVDLGGPGSGNFGHGGRPGERGGSGTGSGATERAQAESIPAGKQGECFRNASAWVREHDDFDLVHGTVTNGAGRTFDHAWAESDKEVADPTTGVKMGKDHWYGLVQAKPAARYSSTQASVNMIRTGNLGPWTAEEVGPRHLGGAGSGNFGHSGRPGEVGGSSGGDAVTTTTTSPEHKAVALRLGPHANWDVSIPDTPTAVRTAEVIADVLDDIKASGGVMPDSITVNHVDGHVEAQIDGKRIVPMTPGSLKLPQREVWTGEQKTHTVHLTVSIPKSLPDDADLDTATRLAFEGSSLVSPRWAFKDMDYQTYDKFAARTMRDVVTHEMGHVQAGHRGENFPMVKLVESGAFEDYDAVRQAMYRVSEYAHTSQDEFMAEAYTRLSRGETLAEDSQKLYDALDGPKVTR